MPPALAARRPRRRASSAPSSGPTTRSCAVSPLVNDAASPLAQLADITAPLLAGPELSVAATKSYIGSLSAIVQLVAHWSGDAALLGALARLPDLLDEA